MKKLTCLFLSLLLAFCLSSCNLARFNLPDTIVINGQEYTRIFISKLNPTRDTSGEADIKVSSISFYENSSGQFNCYIAFDGKAKPNVYFLTEKYEEVLSYYNNGDNYKYFCTKWPSPEYDRTYTIEEIDYELFEQLSDFAEANSYDPFSISNNEDGLRDIFKSYDNWTSYEVKFYRESKDGDFREGGHTLINVDDKLSLLYRYDCSDENQIKIRVRDLPTELNEYFCNLLNTLPNE